VSSDDVHVQKVVGAFLVDNGKVLLGLRAPHKSFPNCWDMFGGHIEEGETEETALSRELQEELGIIPTRLRKIEHISSRQDCHFLDLSIYEVTEWLGGQPRMLGNEHLEIKWFELPDAVRLPNLALEDVRAVIRALTSCAAANTGGKS
jgi:8-oxo-dGTP diphosphatase